MSGEQVPIAVLASGRGSNLQSIIEATAAAGYPARIAVVLSDVENAHALERARAAGIEAVHVGPGEIRARISPEAEESMLAELSSRGVRLIALAGFMRILSANFLASFPGPVLNIHPSLLPSFPGLDAQGQAFRHGVKVTGCTVHLVDEGIDTGPIVMQAAVPVKSGDTLEALSARILEQEHRIYPEAIRRTTNELER